MDDLVSTDWLAAHLGDPHLSILDATLFLPGDTRDAAAEFSAAHILGARLFDIEALSDSANPLPHMLGAPAAFGAAMVALGVNRDDQIIVYDDSPLRSSVRAWFMLRHFGAERVAILDGGLAKWRAEGRPIERGDPDPQRERSAARFNAVERPDVVTKVALLNGTGSALLDARSRARFEGCEAEPRPGVAPGHIPGARNLPFAALYRADGTMRGEHELRAAFADAGIDPQAPFIASCGSGVTACSLLFAARLLGGRDAQLYDGSWSEYGADRSAPRQVGP